MKLKKILRKNITTREFDNLKSENVALRLTQVNLASKNDMANFVKERDSNDKLKYLYKEVTPNKTKHVEA